MDTFTQLALGAACGEAVLGKKIGNRAMVWGAFGGILPDFDVAASFFTDEITALAFHRGFMHSITFAVLAALGLGWLVEWLYHSGTYRRRGYKRFVMAAVMVFYLLLMAGIRWVFRDAVQTWTHLVIAVLIGGGLAFFIWKKYVAEELQQVQATRWNWVWLFFVSIFTHPILDCFTVYGTQLFQPFSDYRVSWDNISVADPAYTIPLALGFIVAAFIAREKRARRTANWTGIALSSAYMAFTFYHKAEFERIFKESLAKEGVTYTRMMSGPTILNNMLWLGVAEGDTAYYHGYYTFFRDEKRVKNFNVIPKNHDKLAGFENDPTLKTLRWFSKDFYNVITRKDGRLQYNDMRYGSFKEGFKDENDYVFKFILEEKDGKLEAEQSREGRKINGEEFGKYWDRVRGKE
jgi:inner membrane protein